MNNNNNEYQNMQHRAIPDNAARNYPRILRRPTRPQQGGRAVQLVPPMAPNVGGRQEIAARLVHQEDFDQRRYAARRADAERVRLQMLQLNHQQARAVQELPHARFEMVQGVNGPVRLIRPRGNMPPNQPEQFLHPAPRRQQGQHMGNAQDARPDFLAAIFNELENLRNEIGAQRQILREEAQHRRQENAARNDQMDVFLANINELVALVMDQDVNDESDEEDEEQDEMPEAEIVEIGPLW
ncbi:hypothetical protein CAEBREN_09480 [Caenorhabditis brenneri]|uniref:Uncharacterized protein n=1 Tax=Caenorhabditis brenneri TaxID=135651 RepID=G0MDH2_CAEBE|nr:hypothetical protein CAEBREN_09480 [Caenorhabditis brenneri]